MNFKFNAMQFLDIWKCIKRYQNATLSITPRKSKTFCCCSLIGTIFLLTINMCDRGRTITHLQIPRFHTQVWYNMQYQPCDNDDWAYKHWRSCKIVLSVCQIMSSAHQSELRFMNYQTDWKGIISNFVVQLKYIHMGLTFNTLRPRQNGRHFADNIFRYIFFTENAWIPIKISLTFVPKGRINNIPALVQIMAWHHPGDKPLSEPMMVSLPMHICVTQPQWVNRAIGDVEESHPLWCYYHQSITLLAIIVIFSNNFLEYTNRQHATVQYH